MSWISDITDSQGSSFFFQKWLCLWKYSCIHVGRWMEYTVDSHLGVLSESGSLRISCTVPSYIYTCMHTWYIVCVYVQFHWVTWTLHTHRAMYIGPGSFKDSSMGTLSDLLVQFDVFSSYETSPLGDGVRRGDVVCVGFSVKYFTLSCNNFLLWGENEGGRTEEVVREEQKERVGEWVPFIAQRGIFRLWIIYTENYGIFTIPATVLLNEMQISITVVDLGF